MDEIEHLDGTDWWRLKGLVCKISLNLYKKFTNDLRLFDAKRTKSKKIDPAREQMEAARKNFMKEILQRLNNAHIGLILLTTTQFVGTRALATSLKFVALSLKYKQTRELLKPHIKNILANISLPLFMTTEKDYISFEQDPIEYVRASIDGKNELNVRR